MKKFKLLFCLLAISFLAGIFLWSIPAEAETSGEYSNDTTIAETVDTEATEVVLSAPTGDNVSVTTQNIVLGFIETVTAVENKTVTISDGANIYTYTIGSNDNCISQTGSDCKATIPVSSFLNGTVPLSFGDSTTYTVAVETGAYVDSVGNPIAESDIGSFKTGYSYTYNIVSGQCYILKYIGSGGDVIIPDTIEGYPVKYIENFAFEYCNSLTSVTLPNSISSTSYGMFYYCTSLKSVKIPNNVTTISGSTFSQCSALTSITIPSSVTSIENNAFIDCDSLINITLPDSVITIGNFAFGYCDGLTSITIPNKVTSIGDYTFYRCTSLTSVTIPDNVTAIGENTFNGCKKLTSITIPSKVTAIGAYAFAGCTLLNSLTIPSGVTSIKEYTFSFCSNLNNITIPENVVSIGNNAFYYCKSLTSITIPKNVTSIGKCAFGICSKLTCFNVEEGNAYFSSQSGVLYDNDKSDLVYYPAGLSDSSFSIPRSVTAIGSYAFSDCNSLISIAVPNSITSIGNNAFNDCSALIGITIPNSVTSIGDSAFSNCSALIGITIPNSITSIGLSTFSGCSSLTSVTIPNSVTSIGDYAFVYCYALTSITIPDSIISIGISAFNTSRLDKVYFDGIMPTMGSYIFDNATTLSRIYYCKSDHLTSFTSIPVQQCSNINNVTVNPGIANGTITLSTASGMEGETISLNILPDPGYRLKSGSLKYNDGSSDYYIIGTSFNMPGCAVTVTGEFEKIPAPIFLTPDAGATNNIKPVWSWTDTTGEGYYRYKRDDAADWVYTVTANYTPSVDLTEGDYTLYVQEIDANGYWSESSSLSVSVDTTVPAAPVITGITPDTGIPNDKITNANTLTISGTAEAGSTVIIQYGITTGTAKADDNGNWNYTTETPLDDGTYSFTANATDEAGNTGSSSDSCSVTIDTTASTTGTIAGTVTDGTNPIEGANVSLTVDGSVYSSTTATDGSYSISGVPAGTGYTVTAGKTGYTGGNMANVVVTAGEATSGVDITLTPVSDQDGCLVTYQGAQKRYNADSNTYEIRFIATIDTLDADAVGFVLSKSQSMPTIENASVKSTTKVYTSITAAGETVTAADLGGTYIIACTITGIPAGEIDTPLYVRAFSTVGTETKYTSVTAVTVSSLS